MEHKNNCAARVKWVLTNSLHQDGKKPIREIWSELLFDTEVYSPDDFELIKLIETLSNETKLIGVKAKKLGLPENLYKPYVEKTLTALNISNLNAAWDNYKKLITSDILVCFSFCTYLIDENETEIDDEELNKIHDAIKELREDLLKNIEDPLLANFIENQIAIISKALAEYHIKGCSALNYGFANGLTEIVENEETIKNNLQSASINKVEKAWGLFQNATKKAAEVNKSSDTWEKVIGRGAKLIEYISNIT